MYGYSIPRYAREYLAEWRRQDRFLRLRWSLDDPGMFILERKTRYVRDYPFVRGTDRQIQLNDGYRKVLSFEPNMIQHVAEHLELNDIQRFGANYLAERLRQQEDTEEDRLSRSRLSEFEAQGSEAYDRLAWLEGRKVSMGGHGL